MTAAARRRARLAATATAVAGGAVTVASWLTGGALIDGGLFAPAALILGVSGLLVLRPRGNGK